jgi:DNA-binding GntR family transcriptional regulator
MWLRSHRAPVGGRWYLQMQIRHYQQIKQKIVTTEMRWGAVIRKADLMQNLRLGRTLIREALK